MWGWQRCGLGTPAARRAGGLSVYSGQGPGVSAASLESVSRNQKPQAAGSPGDSGLAGIESANLPRPADAGGQEFRQQHLEVSPSLRAVPGRLPASVLLRALALGL